MDWADEGHEMAASLVYPGKFDTRSILTTNERLAQHLSTLNELIDR